MEVEGIIRRQRKSVAKIPAVAHRTPLHSLYLGDEGGSKMVSFCRSYSVSDDEKGTTVAGPKQSGPNESMEARQLKMAAVRRLCGEYLGPDTIVRKVRLPKGKRRHVIFVNRNRLLRESYVLLSNRKNWGIRQSNQIGRT